MHIYHIVRNICRYPIHFVRRNKVHRTAQINSGVFLNHSNVRRNCYIGSNSIVNFADIGAYTCIAPNAMIEGMEHTYTEPSINPILNKQCVYRKTTTIGNDVWIAANCIIRQGITIGDGCVIGAGSIVTRDVPENSIVYGSPARVHKLRFSPEKWEKRKESQYWNYPPPPLLLIA